MELIKALKSKKEETSTSNPMEQSEYCYYQSMGQALLGLEKALELRGGQIENVTAEDILSNCNIDPEEFKNVFKDARGLLDDTRQEIEKLFSDADGLLSDMGKHLRLTSIFKRLKKDCPMLRVLRLVNDHSVWRDNLKKLVIGIAEDWPPIDSPAWDYLYANFCCQFALILEKWETSDFSDSHLEDCVRLVDIWLSANGMIGDNAGDILYDWE